MSFFVLIMILFAVSRMCGFRPRGRHHWRRMQWQPQQPVEAVPPPKESSFERVKRRFVNGDISDEQFEREVDALLKTPEGRAQV
jgi:hypothetical protein